MVYISFYNLLTLNLLSFNLCASYLFLPRFYPSVIL